MSRTNAQPRRGVGFSLVEIALCLAITAVVLAMTMILANYAFTSEKTNDANQEIQAIVSAVHNLSASQGSYAGINTAYLAGSGQISSKWINSSGPSLDSAFGVATLTAAGAAPTTFVITFSNIPNVACTNLATEAQGTGLASATLDTVSVTLPMTPTAATAACNVSSGTYKNNHKFAWTFY
jgi:hypothetical protein